MRSSPTPDQLRAAADLTVPDLLEPGLRVLFVGINPSLYSAAVGHHFARPGNRFWRTLHGAGFTPRLLAPSDQAELLMFGLGITNLVARATATAAELSDAELQDGGRRLIAHVATLTPRHVAILGVTAYRRAFGVRDARIGRASATPFTAPTWILPNPSGLNAGYQLPRLIAAFSALRTELDR